MSTERWRAVPPRVLAAILLCAALLTADAELAAQSNGVDRPTPKVLLIGLDGVRVDILREAHTPTIDSLIAAGAYTDDALTGNSSGFYPCLPGTPISPPALPGEGISR